MAGIDEWVKLLEYALLMEGIDECSKLLIKLY